MIFFFTHVSSEYKDFPLEPKRNFYVRTLIVFLSISILAMAYSSFLFSKPEYKITSGIITLVLIVVVLVLSESFNSLSIGKVLKLSREVERKEKENLVAKSENKELRQELFKFVSNVQQSQVNNTFNNPPEAFLKALRVVKSDTKDDEPSDEENPNNSSGPLQKYTQNPGHSHNIQRFAVSAGLNKFVSQSPSIKSSFVERVEFSSEFHAIDPIMDKQVVFSGYFQQGEKEIFLYSRNKDSAGFMFFDRLYLMLSKVNLYRKAKNSKAELLLLLVETDWLKNERNIDYHSRLLKYFQPAIKNGVLKVEYIDISEKEAKEECDKFYK